MADRWDFYPTEEELEKVKALFGNDFKIPYNFSITAEPFKPRANYNRNAQQAQPQLNPQTTEFCEKLGIDDPLEKLIGKPVVLTAPVVNPDEIALEDDDEAGLEDQSGDATAVEGNDLFFVDTKPQKRSKMNLPQPQKKTEEKSTLDVKKESVVETVNEAIAGVKVAEEEPTLHAEKESVDKSVNETIEEVKVAEEDVPTVKKFKRRNQELYMNEESST